MNTYSKSKSTYTIAKPHPSNILRPGRLKAATTSRQSSTSQDRQRDRPKSTHVQPNDEQSTLYKFFSSTSQRVIDHVKKALHSNAQSVLGLCVASAEESQDKSNTTLESAVNLQDECSSPIKQDDLQVSSDDDDVIIVSESTRSPAQVPEPGGAMDTAGARSAEKAGKSRKPRVEKVCPWFKWIPDTLFTVDAFRYGAVGQCTAYFLTHFHSDHYGGLSGAFVHGPIYCSRITRNLIRLRMPRVREDLLHELPLDTPVDIQGVRVTCFDANHCPGAVMFLFETATGSRHLHVGDFRACPQMLEIPALQLQLSTIYLDTTYLRPCHTFPPQQASIELVSELVRRAATNAPVVIGRAQSKTPPPPQLTPLPYNDPYQPENFVVHSQLHAHGVFKYPDVLVQRLLVVVGTYSIGKERMFLGICRALNTKFYCDERKWATLSCYEDPELSQWYCSDASQAGVHVLPLGNLWPTQLFRYLEANQQFTHLLAIRPTGWSFTQRPGARALSKPRGSSKKQDMAGQLNLVSMVAKLRGEDVDDGLDTLRNSQRMDRKKLCMSDLVPQYTSARVTLLGIPYSEHSSYEELSNFVRGVPAQWVIPTVSVGGVGAGSAPVVPASAKYPIVFPLRFHKSPYRGPFVFLESWRREACAARKRLPWITSYQ